MAEGEIIVESGLSWLHDKLISVASERCDHLKDGIAEGVPMNEYAAMVGRYKEAKRWRDIEIPEIFDTFQKADDDSFERDGLEEMNDE